MTDRTNSPIVGRARACLCEPLFGIGTRCNAISTTASRRVWLSTYCGDFQQKKCALDFGPSGNSMENAPPLSSRVHLSIAEFYAASLIQSPRMTFHRENVFGSPFLANKDFDQSHLTPRITSPHQPDYQP